MSQLIRRDLEWPLYRIAKAWGWLLALGIISLLSGLMAITMPQKTLVIIAVLFAVQLILGGLLRFVGALAVPRESGWLRSWMAMHALIAFFAGIFLLQHQVLSILALTLVLGLYWMIHGAMELFHALGHAEMQCRGWMRVGGVLSIIAGGVVFFSPHISLLALTYTIGVWLVVYGAILVVTAWQVRAGTRRAKGSSDALRPTSAEP